jgi:TorA maturation chaperone TorD
MSEPEDALQPAAARDLYALCARLFASEVDASLYQSLAQGPLLSLMGLEPGALGEEDSPAKALDALAVEYCRLFIGPQPMCPPFASACRGEALLGGRARTRLEEFLVRNDLVLTEELMRIASPDHVAVELAILAMLHDRASAAEESSEAMAQASRALAEFLGGHVLPWVPDWLQGVEEHAAHPLYRGAAQLGLALLDEERRRGEDASAAGCVCARRERGVRTE